MATLQIGSAKAHFSTEESETAPDYRKELVKGVYYDAAASAFKPTAYAVGFGRCTAGDITIFSGVKFNAANWALVEGYWASQTLITFVDIDGLSLPNCRVRVTSVFKSRRFPDKIKANLEIWRV